jgi:5-methylcytosine-specific restriction endonuclease McrA
MSTGRRRKHGQLQFEWESPRTGAVSMTWVDAIPDRVCRSPAVMEALGRVAEGCHVCSKCGEQKQSSEFYSHPRKPGSVRTICKSCMATAEREYKSTPEFRDRKRNWPSTKNRVRVTPRRSTLSPKRVAELREYDRNLRASNPGPYRERTRQWVANNRERALASSNESGHIARAREHNVPFERGITREGLRRRDGDRCFYCGVLMFFGRLPRGEAQASEWYATIDHVVAISNGGSHTWENVVLACAECNRGKGYRSAELWIESLLRRGIISEQWAMTGTNQ